MKPLTEDQRHIICVMRMSGKSYTQIASLLHVHHETVARYCRRNNIDSDVPSALRRSSLLSRIRAALFS